MRKKEEKLLSEQDYIQTALVQSPKSYCSDCSLMKAVHRVSSRLPRSPGKKTGSSERVGVQGKVEL